MHQSLPPDWHLEHDHPSWRSDGFLSIDSQLDLVKLRVDPVIVASVSVQLSQYSHCLLGAVSLDKVSW